jgi:hypothetical protein
MVFFFTAGHGAFSAVLGPEADSQDVNYGQVLEILLFVAITMMMGIRGGHLRSAILPVRWHEVHAGDTPTLLYICALRR